MPSPTMATTELIATCSGGIIFTGDSVRAIREGRKTRTTRLIWPKPNDKLVNRLGDARGDELPEVLDRLGPKFFPRYRMGGRYYVKETWCCKVDMVSAKITDDFYYRLDDPDVVKVDGYGCMVSRKDGSEASPWLSPMRMPKRAARYVIEIEGVTLMRLQDITTHLAAKEGVPCWTCGGRTDGTSEADCGCFHSTQMARDSFAIAWNAINGKRATWDSNPWVWSYSFHMVKP